MIWVGLDRDPACACRLDQDVTAPGPALAERSADEGVGSEPTVDALVAGIAAGDIGAFVGFYDRLAARMFGVACDVVGDGPRSEAVVEEVMLEIWRIAPNCDPVGCTATEWALAIAHRRAVDRVRSEVADRDSGRRHPVCAALAGLPETQSVPIGLAYFDGQTHTQIAERLRLPHATVADRVRHGLRTLHRLLEG